MPSTVDKVQTIGREDKAKSKAKANPKLQTSLQTAMRETDAPKAADIVAARRALAQARQDVADGAKPKDVKKTLGQIELVLSVTVDKDELAALKDLTEFLMDAVAKEDMDAALDFQELASRMDIALTQSNKFTA